MHLVHCRRMHRAFCIKATNKTDVIHTLRHVWKQAGNRHAALPILFEFPRRTQHRRSAIRKLTGDAQAFRQRLTFKFLQCGLWIKRIHLAGSPNHE